MPVTTLGPYLSQNVIPEPVSEVNLAQTPLDSGNTGITTNDGNAGITIIVPINGNTAFAENDSITGDGADKTVPRTLKIPLPIVQPIREDGPIAYRQLPGPCTTTVLVVVGQPAPLDTVNV